MADDWADLLAAADVPAGKPVTAPSPWGPLMLVRDDERILAISDVCSHQGAPLHRGPINRQTGSPVATCPAHGSMFDLATGAVRRGPAMGPVAAFEAKVEGDRVLARPA